MRKGDLVRVWWGGELNRESALGEVLDYRPDVLGGSSTSSWLDKEGRLHPEITTSPRRGQVLILLYEDGGMAWWDEKNVEEVKDGN